MKTKKTLEGEVVFYKSLSIILAIGYLLLFLL